MSTLAHAHAMAPSAADARARTFGRIASIDVIRGAVMALMAIDHVRVFSGIPAGGPSAGVFFTRWVTHFCAPAFVFLAGTSAWFYGRRHADLSRFLLTRGLWLVLLELTVIRLGWTFNVDYRHYVLAGVIWMIGWSMVLMAVIVKLPRAVIAIFGLALIGGHNLLDPRIGAITDSLGNDARSAAWKLLYVGFYAGPIMLGPRGPALSVLYSLAPWVGVMAAGYAFAPVLAAEPAKRTRACLAIGLGATALFLVLRGLGLYGDPNPWHLAAAPGPGGHARPPLFAFLSANKYPASLQFLLMTLGPTIALMPALEHARGPLARWLSVFGRVPLFFYVLHIPLIHVLALFVSQIHTGAVSPWLFTNHPMGNPEPPPGYTWSLAVLYGVWALAIVLLYGACRWFAALKEERREGWLKYL